MNDVLTHLLEASIVGGSGLIIWFLKHLAKSIDDLNLKMGVYIERVTRVIESVDDHENRMRKLENDIRVVN